MCVYVVYIFIQEVSLFLKALLHLPQPSAIHMSSPLAFVFICRRGKDSAIATEAVHALFNAAQGPQQEQGVRGAPQQGGPPIGGPPGRPPTRGMGPPRVFNLDRGLEGLVEEGLIRMAVP